MNWQNYLKGLLISTLLFGGVLLFLTIFLGPQQGVAIIVTYYISIFFFTLGLTAISGFLIRRWWMHNEVLFGSVKISIRQAFLFSCFAVSCLLLSSLRLLNIWDGVILGISFVLIEMYFRARSFDEV